MRVSMKRLRTGNLLVELTGRRLSIRQDAYMVLSLEEVRDITSERLALSTGERVLHLRVLGRGRARSFFLSHDLLQTNVREVPSHLPNLAAVLEWLLPSFFLARQGDVGLYLRNRLPAGASEIAVGAYAVALTHVLGRRHRFAPLVHCRFFGHRRRAFVRVHQAVRLLHPEHAPLRIDSGLYEIRAARGRALPGATRVRESSSELLAL